MGNNEIAATVEAKTMPKKIKEIKEDRSKTKETREIEGTSSRRTTRQIFRNYISPSSKLPQKHTLSPIWFQSEPLSTYMGKHAKHPSPNVLKFIFSPSEQQSDSPPNKQNLKKTSSPRYSPTTWARPQLLH